MNIVCLFLVGELAKSIDNLAAVVLSVLNVLGSTHNGYVYLTATCTYVVPVDEVDVSELTAVKNAVLDGHGLASAEEAGTKVTVGVHRGIVAGLVNKSTELGVDRTGVTVLMLLCKVGDHLSHYVEKVVLKILEIERVDVVRALLNHYGAGGVVRSDTYGTVLDAGLLNDVKNVACYVVEGGDPTSGLKLDFFLKNFEFHCKILLYIKYLFNSFIVEALAYSSARMNEGKVHLLISGILNKSCLERIKNSISDRKAGSSLTIIFVTFFGDLHTKNDI